MERQQVKNCELNHKCNVRYPNISVNKTFYFNSNKLLILGVAVAVQLEVLQQAALGRDGEVVASSNAERNPGAVDLPAVQVAEEGDVGVGHGLVRDVVAQVIAQAQVGREIHGARHAHRVQGQDGRAIVGVLG